MFGKIKMIDISGLFGAGDKDQAFESLAYSLTKDILQGLPLQKLLETKRDFEKHEKGCKPVEGGALFDKGFRRAMEECIAAATELQKKTEAAARDFHVAGADGSANIGKGGAAATGENRVKNASFKIAEEAQARIDLRHRRMTGLLTLNSDIQNSGKFCNRTKEKHQCFTAVFAELVTANRLNDAGLTYIDNLIKEGPALLKAGCSSLPH